MSINIDPIISGVGGVQVATAPLNGGTHKMTP